MTETWLLTEGYDDKDHPGTAHAHGAQFLLSGHNIAGTAWYHGKIDGVFGKASAAAAKQAKFDIGYELEKCKPTFGAMLRDFLTGTKKITPGMNHRALQRRRGFDWPTDPKGIVIGWPGQGTHSFRLPPNNWESDNAWDIAVPLGSDIIAVTAGTIGPQFGPLPDPDPRFDGIRLHLVSDTNEFYYAHLASAHALVKPGAKVARGQLLGRSGSANGVAHLHIGVKHLFPLIKQAS